MLRSTLILLITVLTTIVIGAVSASTQTQDTENAEEAASTEDVAELAAQAANEIALTADSEVGDAGAEERFVALAGEATLLLSQIAEAEAGGNSFTLAPLVNRLARTLYEAQRVAKAGQISIDTATADEFVQSVRELERRYYPSAREADATQLP